MASITAVKLVPTVTLMVQGVVIKVVAVVKAQVTSSSSVKLKAGLAGASDKPLLEKACSLIP
jgi:hypothetical protein